MSALLSVLLAASVTQQGTEKLVSAEVRASAAPIAIAELAKQINYPLEAMPSTSGDILIIKVKDVSIKSLMAKIATVTKAGWEQTNSGYRLLRTDAMRRQEEAEEQARLTQLVKTEMDKMNKTLQTGGAMTEPKAMQIAEKLAAIRQRRNGGGAVIGGVDEWRIEEGLRQQAPANRMLQTMLPLISPQIIASIPRGRAYVYSNMPNKMQRQLPGNLQASLQTFIREQAIWAKAFKMVSSRQTDQTESTSRTCKIPE